MKRLSEWRLSEVKRVECFEVDLFFSFEISFGMLSFEKKPTFCIISGPEFFHMILELSSTEGPMSLADKSPSTQLCWWESPFPKLTDPGNCGIPWKLVVGRWSFPFGLFGVQRAYMQHWFFRVVIGFPEKPRRESKKATFSTFPWKLKRIICIL